MDGFDMLPMFMCTSGNALKSQEGTMQCRQVLYIVNQHAGIKKF